MGRFSGSRVRAWWFDPRTGTAAEIATYPNGGSVTFDPPGAPRAGNDWILVLDDLARNYPPPGSKDDPQTAELKDEPVIAAGMGAATNTPANGKELVVNGGFDDGGTGWILNGAETASESGSGTALVIKQGTWKSAEQRILAMPNITYTISGKLRTVGCTAPAGILAIFADRYGRELSRRLVSPAAWGTTASQLHRIEAYAPAETRFIDVRLYSSEGGTGQAFFDEVSVVASGK
jgi:hypothetical protein